jgi:hypothetical protein
MRRILILLICLAWLFALSCILAGCGEGSTLPPPGPGQLQIDASADSTVGYGYLSTSFFVNITGGNPPYTVVWTFGDKSDPLVGQRVSHLYEVPGKYSCSCLVMDTVDAIANTGGSVAHDSVSIMVFSSGL